MDKNGIKLFGKQLRKTYAAPDELPDPMRKALEQLTARERREIATPIPETSSADGVEQRIAK